MEVYKVLGTVDHINRSFRDIADQDYIAARLLYRYGLGHQFFWSALQALEKYFKAVLLYNHFSAQGLGHNIVEAYNRLRSIPDIPFDFPQDLGDFVQHLNEEGPNRYFEYPAAATGRELLYLDRAVWYVRRYCYYMRGYLPSKGGQIERFPIEIDRIRRQSEDKPLRVRIFGGYLEQVLDRGPAGLREHLTWKNFHYGRRPKRVIRHYTLRSWSANPTTALQPEIYDELKDLVDLSKPVREYLERLRSQKTIRKMPALGSKAN